MSEGYGRPELLAETEWLWEHRNDPGIRIVDCRPLEAYHAGHIAGAVPLREHNWLKDPENKLFVMPAERFAALMGSLGVGDGTTVVAYSADAGLQAARLWWVLTYYGHEQAKVLNGGWDRWVAEGRPIGTYEPQPEPAVFTAKPNDAVVCRLDELKARLQDPQLQVLDARSDGEWTGGANPHGNRRVGHIPGAAHLEWARFVDREKHGAFRPAGELRQLLAEAGVRPGSEVVSHCQAAIRAAHAAFVLALVGWDRVRVYDGSMAEWANRDDTPLVTEKVAV